MNTESVRADELTPAQCLAILKAFHADERCRSCKCLDWALAELAECSEPAVADEAAQLRTAAEHLGPRPRCREVCPPVEAAITWLLSGRHIADL
jgi:hypothetical protein